MVGLLLQHVATDVHRSPAGSNLESLGPVILLSEPVLFQPVLHDARSLRNGNRSLVEIL